MDDPLKLFLVRHGETEWSRAGKHTGSTDIPLTPHGEDQARALATHLQSISFAHVFSSPRNRAVRTCELAGLESPKIIADLGEWQYGAYEGLRTVDIRKNRPKWNLWKDGCPEGETPSDVSARVDRLIAYLCTLQGNVALFAHGHLGCAIAARWIGLPIAEGQHFVLDPASLSTLGCAPRHPEIRALLTWNVSVRN
jgi:broad specificity phosphatase PhoE